MVFRKIHISFRVKSNVNISLIEILCIFGIYASFLMLRYRIGLISAFVCSYISAKDYDSLKNYSYRALLDKIENHQNNKDLQLLYLRGFMDRAKSENDLIEIINGYKNYMYYSGDKKSVIYADSMVQASLRTDNHSIIGSAYLSKGIFHYSIKEHKKALDYYLIANDYISKTDDNYLKYKVKYNLAHVKYYLGAYQEAIDLFEDCVEYFKVNNYRGYLNTLHSLALCHNRIGNYGYSSDLNDLGIAEGIRLSDLSMAHYFVHLQGINYYFRGSYALAIEYIKDALPSIQDNNDFANESVGYFYVGKSYLGLNQENNAITYFRKVEELFDEKGYIRPDLRECFEFLIDYYEDKKDLNLKLYYIQKLIKADSILNTNYKYLSEKIHKDYDTKKLLQKKAEIRNQLEQRKKKDDFLFLGILVLFFFLLLLSYRYMRNKKIYKQRFNELMNKELESPTNVIKKQVQKSLDLNPEVTQQLLRQLERFEKNKKYLDKDLSLVKLSASFNSNTKYLSKIILVHRGKKFVDYINDLKIDYIIELLKKDRKVRNYTNKGLAEEAGFSSTQRFTNAFISRTGISPTYFIEEMKRET